MAQVIIKSQSLPSRKTSSTKAMPTKPSQTESLTKDQVFKFQNYGEHLILTSTLFSFSSLLFHQNTANYFVRQHVCVSKNGDAM